MHSVRDKDDPRGHNIKPNAKALELQDGVPLTTEDKLFGTPTSGKSASSDLLCCPFCGENAEYDDNTFAHYGLDRPGVECTSCGVRNFAETKESAIEAWNKRAI